MNERLAKGMYGNEFTGPVGRFKLRCGQMRYMKGEVGNAGWYNKAGEKLGFGDLAKPDLLRIAAELEAGEAFLVLGEQDSFWKFVTHASPVGGSFSRTSADVDAPGIGYVLEHARFAMLPGKVISVSDHTVNTVVLEKIGTVEYISMPRKLLVKELLEL